MSETPFRHRSHFRCRPSFGLALVAAVLFLPNAGGAGLRVCDPPLESQVSPEYFEAFEPDDMTDPNYGLRRRAQRVLQNRRDVAAGRISAAEAETRGGLAVGGSFTMLVLPFEYANRPAPYPSSDLEKQLFTGPWPPTGTLRDYYLENSYGLFTVDGAAKDWVTLSEDDSLYENDNHGYALGWGGIAIAEETLMLNDPGTDFGDFDNDGDDGIPNSGDDDGIVDFVVFVSPEIDGVCDKYKNGICGTVGVANTNLWAHKDELGYYITDDVSAHPWDPNYSDRVLINDVLFVGGLTCDGTQNGIAVYAHEMGHALGIADLYDLSPWPNPDSRGLGRWGLMSTGTWNTPDEPSHLIAWCKERLGWLNYFNVNQDVTLCVPWVETTPTAIRLWTQGAPSKQYFVVENRQPFGFDANVLGQGLVIYHIDEQIYDSKEGSNSVNNIEAHKAIDIECADAALAGHVPDADDLDALVNCGDSGDPWCSFTQTTFDANSVPDTRSYAGYPTGVAVRNIGGCDGATTICANFEVGQALAADLCMIDCQPSGCVETTTCEPWWATEDLWINNDDDPDHEPPAEGVMTRLHFRVRNVGPNDLAGVIVDLFYRLPGTGLWWPDTGTLIESYEVPEVLISNGPAFEGFVDFVYPEPPNQTGHWCLGALAHHPLDPQNSTYPPADNNVVQVNHQVLVERAEGGLRTDGGSFTSESKILVYGRTDYGRNLEMRLGTPPLFDDAVIPGDWNLDFDPGPFVLLPNQADSIVVTMSSANAVDGETAHVPLTWWDIDNQVAAGGILLDYRIDCFAPAAVVVQDAECLGPPGDNIVGPTVKLTWAHVDEDSQGNSEGVKYYEVYRSDDQGSAETLIEKVAIDGEFGEPEFQWYDDPEIDAVTVYTYRVRAIDAADNVGAFSAPFVANCGGVVGADVFVDPVSRVRLHANSPNPFHESTRIPFSLPRTAVVSLEVFDLGGRRVRTLVDRVHEAGRSTVFWNGLNDDGDPVRSGVYLVRIRADGETALRKITLVR